MAAILSAACNPIMMCSLDSTKKRQKKKFVIQDLGFYCSIAMIHATCFMSFYFIFPSFFTMLTSSYKMFMAYQSVFMCRAKAASLQCAASCGKSCAAVQPRLTCTQHQRFCTNICFVQLKSIDFIRSGADTSKVKSKLIC